MFYEKSIDRFNDIFNNRIVIPIRKDGNTITFTSRSISDSKSPHLHRKGPMDIPLNFDILKNCQTIFVTEGPFDCMTLHQMG